MFSEPIYAPLINFRNHAPILMDCSLVISITLPRWVTGEKSEIGFPPEIISSRMCRMVPNVKKTKAGIIWAMIMRMIKKKIVWENSRWPSTNFFPWNNIQSNMSGKTDPIPNNKSPMASTDVFHIVRQIKLMPKVHSK